MTLKELLSGRIGIREIDYICATYTGRGEDNRVDYLYDLTKDADSRIGYNALWVLTHVSDSCLQQIAARRNEMIDRVIVETHTGKRRLLMTIIGRLPATVEEIRGDYVDFCLNGINSCEPYALRALCLKQAFDQCRLYPELIQELKEQISLMDSKALSPGLKSARKNILAKISRL